MTQLLKKGYQYGIKETVNIQITPLQANSLFKEIMERGAPGKDELISETLDLSKMVLKKFGKQLYTKVTERLFEKDPVAKKERIKQTYLIGSALESLGQG